MPTSIAMKARVDVSIIKKSGVETGLRSRGGRKRPLLSLAVAIAIAPRDELTETMGDPLHDPVRRRDVEAA